MMSGSLAVAWIERSIMLEQRPWLIEVHKVGYGEVALGGCRAVVGIAGARFEEGFEGWGHV